MIARPLSLLMLAVLSAGSLAHATTIGIQEPAAYTARIDGPGFDTIYASTTDAAGNFYVVGQTAGLFVNTQELSLDTTQDLAGDSTGRPTLATHDTLLTDGWAMFVIKYDRDGHVVWKRTDSSYYVGRATGIAVDSAGNVFVSGFFSISGTFGGITLTAQARSNVNFDNTQSNVVVGSNVFVAMLDQDGLWQWARQFDFALFRTARSNARNTNVEISPVLSLDLQQENGDSFPSLGQSLANELMIDKEGSLYLAVTLHGASVSGSAPADSVFWLRSAGTGQLPIVSTDTGGNVSSYGGTAFIAKLAATRPPAGSPPGTLSTYDWRWITPMNSGVVFEPVLSNGTGGNISSILTSAVDGSVTGMGLDNNDSIYLTGAWKGKLVVGGTGASTARDPFTSKDGYVARVRAATGLAAYVATYSGSVAADGTSSNGGGLVVDEQRNVFVSGAAAASNLKLTSADNTTAPPFNLAADPSSTKLFAAKLSPAGQWLWEIAPGQTGSGYRATTTAITRDPAGALYLAGAFQGPPSGNQIYLSFGASDSIFQQGSYNGTAGAEAFIAKLTEDTGTPTWQWALQTSGRIPNAAPTDRPIYDSAGLVAGAGGTIYWSINGLTGGRFTDSRSPVVADQSLDTIANFGSFVLPIRTDTPKLSPTFTVTTTFVCGTEVVPPEGVVRDGNNHTLQPEIVLADGSSAAASFYWDTFENRLYAVNPVVATVKWKVVADLLSTRRIPQAVSTVWPTPAQGLVTYVTGAGPNGDEPKVALEPPTTNSTFATILYTDNQAITSGNKQFSTKARGYSVLLYVTGKNAAPGTAPVTLDVVRSYLWTDVAVNSNDVATVGTEISGTPYGHADPSGKNGYLVNAKARFDGTGPGAAHNRATQIGPIIPVNTDEPTPDDDMVIIWSNLNGRGVAWPAKTVTYKCDYGSPLEYIVIASQLGSETYAPTHAELLDPAKFQSMTIYNQPDKNLAGYNPNEEHALRAPSNSGSGFDAVFALRSDLNNLGRTTSPPYVLLRYQDASDGLKTKFKVYLVLPEAVALFPNTPIYRFNGFTGTAGTRVQPPYPLSLLPGAAGTTGSGTAYFKDRKNEVWAKSNGLVTARYFYPLQPSFWYDVDGDGLQDSPTEVAWLDRLNGSPGTPLPVTYKIDWPGTVATLALGDTLTLARAGLPDVESMLSASVIYEDANPNPSLDPFSGSARIIDYTTERTAPLIGKVAGENLEIDGVSFAVVDPGFQGRYVFRDLPFHLKSRLSFDPIGKKLILGGYKDSSNAGAPFLLLNILSPRERDRLKALGGNTTWNAAIDALYNLSRNPYVFGGVSGEYYVGLQGTATAPAAITRLDAQGPKALITGKATGVGYVTLVENNGTGVSADLPVALHIINVGNAPVVGAIKVLFNDNVFDEKVTLRHYNDFAGDPTGLMFEWLYTPDVGGSPALPGQPNAPNWIPLASGLGVNDVVIEGASVRTLTDGWVICRYKGYPGTSAYTDWAGGLNGGAQFVPGWIKRVLGKLNGFSERVPFASAPTATYSSFITQAGERYEGAIALNSAAANLNGLGLISLYETVLRRGLDLSIDGTPPLTSNPAVSNALLLASTKISDLYMLLGNEAYADAQDPTIGFTSASGEVGNLAPSVFAFANQVPNLISEELTLLRGRDESSVGVRAAPVYNRLFWNFTGSQGEAVYVQNYGITDQNADGQINEKDARILFPQGHGDAWGHYLSAVKQSYRLLRHPRFEWIPRAETTTVAGVSIEVDYLDEVKFARAAAARADAGAEIVNLTYRDSYVADPAGQWQGYKDSDSARAWGVDEWARRAGQGAYFDWVAGNAILPANHTQLLGTGGGPPPARSPSGLEKIDRTTVTELQKIPSAFAKVQSQMDQADQGLNPLGVTPGSIPFDIDPAFLVIGSGIQGKKHFEQIYERTTAAVKNARQVFDYANALTLRLRQTQISADNFAQGSLEQELDYKNRLIEIYGYPYAGDIGPGKAFPTAYDGPDLIHYNYVAVNTVSGTTIQPDTARTGLFAPFAGEYKLSGTNDLKQAIGHYFPGDGVESAADALATLPVLFPLASAADWSFAAPADWGSRRAPGTLQMAISDVVRAEAELRRGLIGYNNKIAEVKDELDLLRVRNNITGDQINILDGRNKTLKNMNVAIGTLQAISTATSTAADVLDKLTDALKEAVPTSPLDLFSGGRSAIKSVGAVVYTVLQGVSAGTEIAANSIDLAKEEVGNTAELEIFKSDFQFDVQERLKSIEALLREEVGLRLDLFNLREALRSSVGNYFSILAEGSRVLDERIVYRQKVAGAVQQNRYQDLTFRLFRNDSLQKYRAAFDLAARYTYLAATTYDYETCQLGSSNAAGRRFLTDIVRERALGGFLDDNPVAGVNGLSDPLARLNQNYQVLKGRLGINNPQIETGRFSLRHELFRLRDETDQTWHDLLQTKRVDNLWAIPEFRRFCRPFAAESAGAQPGLVITFSTDVTFEQNYFGLPLGGGDSSYDPSNFVTKINAAGVWFSNYNAQGMSVTPRVYLIPVGLDVMRAPNDVTLATREFDVVDQAIPVPFPVGGTDLANPRWIPANDNLDSPIGEIRQFSRFRAYHDDGFDPADLVGDSRLVGRSVWNTKWMLIIPGGTFLNDPKDGLDTFILGKKLPGSETRDGNGVKDIKLFFQTYSYSGN